MALGRPVEDVEAGEIVADTAQAKVGPERLEGFPAAWEAEDAQVMPT